MPRCYPCGKLQCCCSRLRSSGAHACMLEVETSPTRHMRCLATIHTCLAMRNTPFLYCYPTVASGWCCLRCYLPLCEPPTAAQQHAHYRAHLLQVHSNSAAAASLPGACPSHAELWQHSHAGQGGVGEGRGREGKPDTAPSVLKHPQPDWPAPPCTGLTCSPSTCPPRQPLHTHSSAAATKYQASAFLPSTGAPHKESTLATAMQSVLTVHTCDMLPTHCHMLKLRCQSAPNLPLWHAAHAQ